MKRSKVNEGKKVASITFYNEAGKVQLKVNFFEVNGRVEVRDRAKYSLFPHSYGYQSMMPTFMSLSLAITHFVVNKDTLLKSL